MRTLTAISSQLSAVSHQQSIIKPEKESAGSVAAVVVMLSLIADSYELKAFYLPEASC